MNQVRRYALALLALAALSAPADAGTITANQKYQLNHMNSVANNVQLGTLIDNISLGAAPLTSAHLLVGDGTNAAADVAASGDLTLANTGAFTIAAGVVTAAKLGPDAGNYTSSITVSQADLLAINSVPKQLIAAPGAGKVILVDEVEVLHTYSTAAYTTCGKVQIQYHGTTDIVDLAAAVITGASSKTYFAKPSFVNIDNTTGSAPVDFTGLANKAVDFTAATADCAAGNAANILKVRLKYRTLTLQT